MIGISFSDLLVLLLGFALGGILLHLDIVGLGGRRCGGGRRGLHGGAERVGDDRGDEGREDEGGKGNPEDDVDGVHKAVERLGREATATKYEKDDQLILGDRVEDKGKLWGGREEISS